MKNCPSKTHKIINPASTCLCGKDKGLRGSTPSLGIKTRQNAYRIAPSPTGYVHLGTIAMAIINSALAKQNNGVFYLRIEDTDQKRLLHDAVPKMLEVFNLFNIKFSNVYTQSERKSIYQTYANQLIKEDKAYRCFCTEQDLTKMREKQEQNGEKTGYYGKYAACKYLSQDQIQQKLKDNQPFVIRADFSKFNGRIEWNDAVKGKMSLPAETADPIILKSNGMPPYNFAHVIDDHLMQTAVVIRGEEWLVSTAAHIQLSQLLGFPPLSYAHLPTINIDDNGKKRKLSKRKDKEALVINFINEGYPKEAIIEYLLTIYNTDFELWRIKNPNANLNDFNFQLSKVGSNNPLLDIPKLNNISKNYFSKLNNKQILQQFLDFNFPFPINNTEKNRIKKMLCIDRETERPRKDLTKWIDIKSLYDFCFDDFIPKYPFPYDYVYKHTDSFQTIKDLCKEINVNVRDFTQSLRLSITNKDNTPDLFKICEILGESTVNSRLKNSLSCP
ncbi:MAG: glutamate--tRNA ligase [Christensenellaceae bacterium]|nr:glutamate--tRNA ligase [Christensenellaceae bacterium]